MKKIIGLILVGVMLSAMAVNAYASEAVNYYTREGYLLLNAEPYIWDGNWFYSNGEWYCLDADGYLLHDCWVGNYFLDSEGRMARNLETPGGYYVGADGLWIPGYDTQGIQKITRFYNSYPGVSVRIENGIMTVSGYGHTYYSNGRYYTFDKDERRTVQFMIDRDSLFVIEYLTGDEPISLDRFLSIVNEGDYDILGIEWALGTIQKAAVGRQVE